MANKKGFKVSARSRRKARRKKIEIQKKEFKYRGLSLEELQKIPIDDLLPLLPSRMRRSLKRGLTKGQGFSGPVKRFGITLKSHKSEKGRRRPGSLGPWHPARVTFRVPMAGQLGMFTRVVYNSKILDLGKSEDKFKNIKNFGDVKTDYIIVTGSVQGPAKRQLLITAPLRESKKQTKKNYELLEIR